MSDHDLQLWESIVELAKTGERADRSLLIIDAGAGPPRRDACPSLAPAGDPPALPGRQSNFENSGSLLRRGSSLREEETSLQALSASMG